MNLSRADFAAIRAKTARKKAKRVLRVEDNAALGHGTAQGGEGKSPKARKHKSSRKRLVAQLDELCSQYVRKRDGIKTGGLCVFGCGRPIFCWFHFIKRSRSLKTRWDHEDNLVASCAPCNGYMEHNEAPFWVWYIKNRGANKMEALEARSHGSANYSIADLEAVRDDLTRRLLLL